jgi:hypothetical protein
MVGEAVNPEIIKRRMWLDYQRVSNDPANDRLECVHELMDELVDPTVDLGRFLWNATNTISSKLAISQVTIGVRDPKDGLYRYQAMCGLEDSEWEAHKKLSYTREQFDSQEVYKFKEVSKHTRLFLVEDNPYGDGEDNTYRKDLMLQDKRSSLEDTIEGDYIDTLVFGKNDELIGWIELGGMKNGKFPDGQTLITLELLAAVIGVALTLLGPVTTSS